MTAEKKALGNWRGLAAEVRWMRQALTDAQCSENKLCGLLPLIRTWPDSQILGLAAELHPWVEVYDSAAAMRLIEAFHAQRSKLIGELSAACAGAMAGDQAR